MSRFEEEFFDAFLPGPEAHCLRHRYVNDVSLLLGGQVDVFRAFVDALNARYPIIKFSTEIGTRNNSKLAPLSNKAFRRSIEQSVVQGVTLLTVPST